MANAASARLEARVSPDIHALLKRAAELEGRSLSDFVITAAKQAAQKTLEEHEIIKLSLNDQIRFAQALLEPPADNPALQQAFARHRQMLETE